jgi:hypothetical protein
MTATSAAAELDAETRSILERAAAASFPPLPAVHHLLSVGVRLLAHLVFLILEIMPGVPPFSIRRNTKSQQFHR